MPLTWKEIQHKMDTIGVPKLVPCAKGFKEPDEIFFDATMWRWMGRSTSNVGTHFNPDMVKTLWRQLEDGRWISVRIATESDNARIDAARAAISIPESRYCHEAIR
jgi:hypothetical protein